METRELTPAEIDLMIVLLNKERERLERHYQKYKNAENCNTWQKARDNGDKAQIIKDLIDYLGGMTSR